MVRRRRQTIAQSVIGSGLATGPGAGVTVASIAAALIPKGYYDIEVALGLSGTITAAEANNMRLNINGVALVGFVVLPAGTVVHVYTVRHRFTNGAVDMTIQAIAAAGVAAVYHASMIATRISPGG